MPVKILIHKKTKHDVGRENTLLSLHTITGKIIYAIHKLSRHVSRTFDSTMVFHTVLSTTVQVKSGILISWLC